MMPPKYEATVQTTWVFTFILQHKL